MNIIIKKLKFNRGLVIPNTPQKVVAGIHYTIPDLKINGVCMLDDKATDDITTVLQLKILESLKSKYEAEIFGCKDDAG